MFHLIRLLLHAVSDYKPANSNNFEVISENTVLESIDESTVSDVTLKRTIWGPFYYISKLTLLIFDIPKTGTRTAKGVLHLIPNIIVSVVLFSNTIYGVLNMSSISFSINWAYSTILLFIAFHGFFSSLVMLVFKYTNYFSKTIFYLRKATRNRVSFNQSS